MEGIFKEIILNLILAILHALTQCLTVKEDVSKQNLEIEPILSSPDSRDTDEVNVQCYKGTFS
jgi:hypothetical protein